MGKNKKVIYYSVCILFILLLLFSNKIIASVNYYNVKKFDIDIENLKKNEVYYSTDEIVIKNDLFDSFYIRGWAFCETTFDNSNKEIWVLLANDKDKYAHKVNINKRNDVFDVFKRKSGIKDANVGILNTISTVDVKNGVYKIYLYCKENAENYGLVDINQMIKKDGRGLSIPHWYSTPQNNIEPNKGKYAKCNVDSGFLDDNKYLQIKGWTFVEGQRTAEQAVFVRLNYENGKSVTYNTQSYYRYDVGTAFKNIIYDKSGFTAIIPKDELQDGNIQIDVLVKNGDSIYLAEKKYVYVYNDFEESFILREAKERETVNKEINIDLNNIKEDSNIKYYVDSCTLGEFLSIKGWAYISDKNASNTSVYLAITKPDGSTRVFSTAKVSRSDVAKHFNNELYYESGFKSVIPQDAIVEGDNIITIITEDGEMVKASKTYTFSYTNEK